MSNKTSNKSKTLRHRESSVLYMKLCGLPVTMKPDFAGKVSAALREETPSGDVQGLKDWTINTRSEVSRQLGGGVDEAKRDAFRDGTPYSATIWYRQLAGVEQSFVVMSLEDFTQALLAQKDADQ
jgi:hypothetical protein